MIFITLGSQKFQFDRLLIAIDKLCEKGIVQEEVFAQIGYSTYEPQNYKFARFLNRDEFIEKTDRCDIFITHGGTGAIIGAVKKGKRVIAVPRLAKYGEHVDDHQLQLLKEFGEMGIIVVCLEVDELQTAYEKIHNIQLKPYKSNQKRIIADLDEYIESL